MELEFVIYMHHGDFQHDFSLWWDPYKHRIFFQSKLNLLILERSVGIFLLDKPESIQTYVIPLGWVPHNVFSCLHVTYFLWRDLHLLNRSGHSAFLMLTMHTKKVLWSLLIYTETRTFLYKCYQIVKVPSIVYEFLKWFNMVLWWYLSRKTYTCSTGSLSRRQNF